MASDAAAASAPATTAGQITTSPWTTDRAVSLIESSTEANVAERDVR